MDRESYFKVGSAFIMKANLATMELTEDANEPGMAIIDLTYIVFDHAERMFVKPGVTLVDARVLMGIKSSVQAT